jgi:hypothetical protein
MCPFIKYHFYVYFIRTKQVILKVGLIDSPNESLTEYFCIPGEYCTALTAHRKISLLYLHLLQRGGEGVGRSPEIGATLVRLFYCKIIRLATELVQQLTHTVLAHL